jgi:hypothetical protein
MAARRSPPAPRRSGPRVVGAPSSSQYEFNDQENAVIQGTSSAATKWGWLLLIGGVAGVGSITWSLIQAFNWITLATLVGPLFMFFVGSMFRSVGQYFSDVVNTSGNDVKLMMRALERMGIVLFAQFFLAIVGIGIAILTYVLLRYL